MAEGTTGARPRSKAEAKAEIEHLCEMMDHAGRGTLAYSDIKTILTKMDGRTDESDIAGIMRRFSGTARSDAAVPSTELVKWYLGKHYGVSGNKLNRLLIKPALGAPRASSYSLPPEDFAFGLKSDRTAIGAKVTVSEWYAPDQRSTRSSSKTRKVAKVFKDPEHVFGKPAMRRGGSSTADVTKFKFGGHEGPAEPEYASHSSISRPKISSGAQVRPTRSYLLSASKAREARSAATKAEADVAAGPGKGAGWKIKKFSHASPVIDTHATRAPAAYREMMRRRRVVAEAMKRDGTVPDPQAVAASGAPPPEEEADYGMGEGSADDDIGAAERDEDEEKDAAEA